jgi:hypothetical protein
MEGSTHDRAEFAAGAPLGACTYFDQETRKTITCSTTEAKCTALEGVWLKGVPAEPCPE